MRSIPTSASGVRRALIALAALLAIGAAPLALAGNLGFSLSFFGPGYGVNYSGCSSRWCGNGAVSAFVSSGWGWRGGGWGGGWAPAYYAPAYYAPRYYYAPAPVYYARPWAYERRPVVQRVYTSRTWYVGHDDGWRRGDYDRGGYRGRGDEGWRGRAGWQRDRDGGWRRSDDRGGAAGYWRDDRGDRRGDRGHRGDHGGRGNPGYWGHGGH